MDIALIGAGRAGTALAYLLQENGYSIKAVSSRSKKSLERARNYLSSLFTQDNNKAASQGQIVIISVNDDSIAKVCRELAVNEAFQENALVIHLSGALSLDVLKPALDKGCLVGAMHPIQTLADVESAIVNLPGASFGVTAGGQAKGIIIEMVEKIGGKPIIVGDDDKSLYHAAACVISNYFVTLYYTASELYKTSTGDDNSDIEDFWPLLEGTLNNLKALGPIEALTGPLSRGDENIIMKHLKSIDKKAPIWSNLYREMGLATLELINKRKELSKEKIKQLQIVLGKE